MTFLMKIVLIVGIAGACRREELCKIKIQDIEEHDNVLIITIPDTKTHISRKFVVYAEGLLPKIDDISRFFVASKRGKCSVQPMGINTIGKIPTQIATYLKLSTPKKYNSHCYGRTSATLLVDAGGDVLSLKRLGEWKSSSVAESYVEDSLQNKLEIAKQINGVKQTTENCLNFNNVTVSKTFPAFDSQRNLPSMTFGNVQHSNININFSCK